MQTNKTSRTNMKAVPLWWLILLLIGSCFLPVSCTGTAEKPIPEDRMNILLLVADDLGYADLGCYGGSVATPYLDALATRGIRFSNFHTAPMCAPSRAMLLTGTDNHIAGMGRQNLQADVFGYEGELSNRIVPVPALLRAAGYHTYMAGKWHLGASPRANPHEKGFEHSFVLLEGVGNQYSGKGIFKNPGASHYTEDGHAVSWPEGRYSTNLYTDKLISYIDGQWGDNKPFFAYAAYTSPHWPLQVDSSYWQKYEGTYRDGYDILRVRQLESLKSKGLIPASSTLPPRFPSVLPWDSLNAEEQMRESRKMELYAGMVDNLDENIGRLLNHLKSIGAYENTLIIFISDNGAAGEDYFNEESIKPYINPLYQNSYNTMGTDSSLVSYGPQWAEAGSAPFRNFKEYTANGGIITPMIIAGPVVKDSNSICHKTVTIMDLAPTMYDVAGSHYPESWNGRPVYPLEGKSLLMYISGRGQQIHPPDYAFGLEHSGHTMYQKGNWKINSDTFPFREANFELYDLATDPEESTNLREAHPETYKELLGEWKQFIRRNRVQLPH